MRFSFQYLRKVQLARIEDKALTPCGLLTWANSLRFCYLEAGHGGVGVMGEADAVDAVGRFELAGRHDLGAREACDLLFVDRARHSIAFYRDRDLLRHRLADTSGFVHGRVRLGCTAAELK